MFERTAHGIDEQYSKEAFGYLARDGYRINGNGSIVGGPVALLREESLANLGDPAAIRDHLDRISRAIEGSDPAQAVGSAKELIESTAKVVLQELNEPVDPKDDVPQLVSKAQRALGVHPSSVGTGPDSSDAVKKILAVQRRSRLGWPNFGTAATAQVMGLPAPGLASDLVTHI